MRTTLAAAVLAVTVVGAATAAPARAANLDTCEITVDGAVKAAGVSRADPGSATSHYWNVPDEVQESTTQRRGSLLRVVCSVRGVSVVFSPPPRTEPMDFPMDAGTFRFAPLPKVKTGQPKPQEMEARVVVQKKEYATEGGTFTITAWNKRHVAGSFDFKARPREAHKKGGAAGVTIKGSFDFSCMVGRGCER